MAGHPTPQSSLSQPQANSTFAPKGVPGIKGEVMDAAISISKDVVAIAGNVAADIPIPGLSQACSALEVLLDRIKQMRSNMQDTRETIETIESLRGVLNLSVDRIRDQTKTMDVLERRRLVVESSVSDELTRRISALTEELNAMNDLAKQLPQKSRWKRFMYTEQEADFLKSIKRRVMEATNQFRIQGEINVEWILSKMSEQMRQMDYERLLKVHHDILEKLNPADACYRSYVNEEKAHLLPGTREQVLKELVGWATRDDIDHRVYVLYGPAGIGKSSIAHALSRELGESHLASTFFFHREMEDCSNPYRVFPTIAYQLAHAKPELLLPIVDAVRKHLPQGRLQTIDYQIQELLKTPLSHLSGHPSPALFVVDGIDECANDPEGSVALMLQHLCRLAHELPFLRILIATRPETHIMAALRTSAGSSAMKFGDLQTIAREIFDRDITSVLEAEFRKCAENGPFTLLTERPRAVTVLTRLADGLFIYASTVARYLTYERRYAVDIYDTLVRSHGSMPGSSGVHDRLDALYNTILHNAFARYTSDSARMGDIRKVLTWIALAGDGALTAKDLEQLGVPTRATLDSIDRLRSVLIVEEPTGPESKLQACHASFPQFLLDSTRCKESAFHISSESGHSLIATALLDYLIGEPVSTDCVGGEARTTGHLSPSRLWAFASMRWTSYVCHAEYTTELKESLVTFVKGGKMMLWLIACWLIDAANWSHYEGAIAMLTITLRQSDGLHAVKTWYSRHEPDGDLAGFISASLNTAQVNFVLILLRDEYWQQQRELLNSFISSTWRLEPPPSDDDPFWTGDSNEP
ncbi:hypothetical protein OBBRIDRAFT_796150 [Obba rivulosa]|uniref:NACHT domain-containing protein n=1 Tax=Obba rivulosa TaxID=1052685 RepID=A0A8E2ANJ9_9APHY|nr:hypothetical protein OBBRIDRAFT_796150 [Obba rivulosa]